MTINAELQSLNPSAEIEMYEVDLTSFGDVVHRFYFGTNELQEALVWQGETYDAWAGQAVGFDMSTSGQSPRPKIILGNTSLAISALIVAYNDLVGAKVTRKRTLKKYLDAANFASGNPDADPDAHLPDDIFYINRKVNETSTAVEFELAAAYDVVGIELPRRQIVQNMCPWRYRGTECGYAGTTYFDAQDNPVAASGLDVCGKRLSSCKLRFGETAELPFGGFPGAGLIG